MEGATVVVNLDRASGPNAVRLDASARGKHLGNVGTTFAEPLADGRILLTS
jgi:hypothetical protein